MFTNDDLRYAPLTTLKVQLLLATFFFRYFLTGAEYTLILPSVMLRMKKFPASNSFVGIVVAAYPLAAIISLPILGHIYDRTRRVKLSLLVLNGFQIVGNVLYCLPFSKWLPVIGRFIAGLGDGFIVLVIGELTFLYPRSQIVGMLSMFEFGRVFGMTVGPIVSYFSEKQSVLVHDFELDSNTIPGALMATAWAIMEIVTVAFAFDVAKGLLDAQKDLLVEQEIRQNQESIYIERRSSHKPENILNLESDWNFDRVSNKSDDSGSDKLLISNDKGDLERDVEYWPTLRQLFSIDLLVIFTANLFLWFSQTIFEVLIPFVCELDYGLTPQVVGAIYMVGAVIIAIGCFITYWLGRKYTTKDAPLIMVSLVITQLAFALLIYHATLKSLRQRLTVFLAMAFCIFASVPFHMIASKALLTKIFPPEMQGIVQGLSAGISRLALIGGPLLSGLVFEHWQIYGVVGSVTCYFLLLGMYWSLGKLTKRQKGLVHRD